MNQTLAQNIINRSTEVLGGLFVFIDQGQKVLDCTSYNCTLGRVFTIDVYAPKGEIDPVMDVICVTRDFNIDDYQKVGTEYFATAQEMKARVFKFIMGSTYF